MRVTGRVQGVGYRDWACDLASRLGLDGFVRNRRDGSVEALVSGDQGAVDAFVAACRTGPPAARVDAVEISAAQGLVTTGFTRKPTV